MKELYLFNDGGTEYPFTPHKLSSLFGGKLYLPTSISRSAIEITPKLTKSPVTFSFARSNSFAKDVLLNPRDYPISVIVYRDGNQFWSGRVLEAKGNGINIDLVCDSLHTRFKSTALPKQVGLQCRHNIYSLSCGVNEASYRTTFSISNVSSNVITIPTMLNPTEYYNGGTATLNGSVRRIISQVGTLLTLESRFTGIVSGNLVLAPGCNLSYTNCVAFNNTLNFGGFYYHPITNPFDSGGAI